MSPKSQKWIAAGTIVLAIIAFIVIPIILRMEEVKRESKPIVGLEQTAPASSIENLTIEKVENPEVSSDHSEFRADTFSIIEGRVIWESAGSSTCPPIINSATYSPTEKNVTLYRADYTGDICTMDIRPVQQIISRLNDETLPEDVTVMVTTEVK